MDLDTSLAAFGGIATRLQLLTRGHSGGDLTAAVRGGRIRRIRQGHYARLDAGSDAVAAVRLGGRLAGPSAAAAFGLWSGYDLRLHVSVPRNASRLRASRPPSARGGGEVTPDTSDRSVVLHWTDTAPPDPSEPCWRPSVLGCLRQMVSWSDDMTAVACLDTALQAGLVTQDELEAGLTGPGLRSRGVIGRCRPGSDSGLESLVRQALAARGVDVEQQVRVTSVGPSDMRLRGRRGQPLPVLVEVDGFSFHSRRDAFDRDRRKDAEAAEAGYSTLRFSADQVERDLGGVVATVVRVRDLHDSGGAARPLLNGAPIRNLVPSLAGIRTGVPERGRGG